MEYNKFYFHNKPFINEFVNKGVYKIITNLTFMKKTIFLFFFSAFSVLLIAQIPTNGLVANYPFNGNAIDESGNGVDGTVSGATLATDRFGNQNSAYYFDGIDDKIESSSDDFANGNNVSVSVWVNYNLSGINYFISCSDFGVFSKDSTVGLAISLPGTDNAAGSVNYDEWTHFVGTYDGDTIKSYINGVLAEETLWAGDIEDLNRMLTFGFFNNIYWKGYIDDICIYDRVITESEISDLFNDDASTITSVPPINNNNLYTVYPNPASKNTEIVFNNVVDGIKINILNSIGQIVVEESNLSGSRFNIDISNLAPGIYFVAVIQKGEVYRTKLVIL